MLFKVLRRFALRRAADPPPDPATAAGRNKRGVALAQAGERDAARAEFEAALAIDPRFAPAIGNLGNLAFEGGDAMEALRLLGEAIAIDDAYAPAHANLASVLKSLGRYDEARRAMRTALRLEGRMRRKPSSLL